MLNLLHHFKDYNFPAICSPRPPKPSCMTFRPANSVAKPSDLSKVQDSDFELPWKLRAYKIPAMKVSPAPIVSTTLAPSFLYVGQETYD